MGSKEIVQSVQIELASEIEWKRTFGIFTESVLGVKGVRINVK
jgi:hypothetical protein